MNSKKQSNINLFRFKKNINNKKKLKSFKKNNMQNGNILFFIVFAFCIFGFYMVYSASYVGIKTYTGETTTPWYFFILQIRGFLIAIVPTYIFYKIPQMNKKMQTLVINIFFVISILLLLLTYIFGKPINGSTRWLYLYFITIQPSELLKISLILIVGNTLNKIEKNALSVFLISMIIPFVVAIENLSSGLLMAISIFIMFSVYIFKKNQVFFMAGLVSIFGIVFLFLEEYRKKRIINYITTLIDPLKSDYQTKESLYALANGGFFGKGITYSIQKFFYLPEHHTDFIFAIIGEELGLLGESILIILFFIMIYLIFQVSVNSNTIFKRYVCLGFGVLFAMQIILNLGVVSGFFPVTGVTLPFLSYGGSSILSSLMMIGFILGCSERKREKEKI